MFIFVVNNSICIIVSLFIVFFFFFFFSSRRRHTRYIGDWSSDVCSSDLGIGLILLLILTLAIVTLNQISLIRERHHLEAEAKAGPKVRVSPVTRSEGRSEERRVGKECRYRRGREGDRKRKNEVRV